MKNYQLLKIVIVEDNLELREILAFGLRHFGHDVREACDGDELDTILTAFEAHIIVLDLGLSGEDGISIANRIRRQFNTIGIVMVTARGRIEERIIGLETGADLYFVKPVDIRELESALRSLYRRIKGYASPRWRFRLNTSTLTSPNNADLILTAQECILVNRLLATPGRNVSRCEIFKTLEQPDDQYADRRLEAMISRLRAKLKTVDPASELPIRPRHNRGYAFLADVELE